MINLQLAIYDGDAVSIDFSSTSELLEYLKELEMFDCVWLACNDNGHSPEIIVTENLEKILEAIAQDYWDLSLENSVFFIQEYQSFEEAYDVALTMREGHPKCYI